MNDQTQNPSTAPLPSDHRDANPAPVAPFTPQPADNPQPLSVSSPSTAPPAPNIIEPTIPANQPQASPSASTPPVASPAPATTGSKKKVLLVEDDEALAAVYTTRLTAEGFDINQVPNGEEALASAIQYKPDVVLLDDDLASLDFLAAK